MGMNWDENPSNKKMDESSSRRSIPGFDGQNFQAVLNFREKNTFFELMSNTHRWWVETFGFFQELVKNWLENEISEYYPGPIVVIFTIM